MTTIAIEESNDATLPEMIEHLRPGDEILITKDNQPVARVTPVLPPGKPVAGRCKGMLTIVSEDDEHLEDWKEYMP